MKKQHYIVACVACALAGGLCAADKQVNQRRVEVRVDAGPNAHAMGETEKVTFLGVATAPVGPTLATQLGLAEGTGLVVMDVVGDSPAAGKLNEHDILTRLDDQILVDMHQLSVLIRSKKDGDEVTLTVVRGGKEMKQKVKLATREMPKRMAMGMDGEPGALQWKMMSGDGPEHLPEMPGMRPEEVRDVFRFIGRGPGDMMVNRDGGPHIRVLKRGDGGATILDLPRGNVVYSDEQGSVEVKAEDGKRELIVKDPAGAVKFQGPIASKEDREKLPADIRERLGAIEKVDINVEPNADIVIERADVRGGTPAPSGEKRKIRMIREINPELPRSF